MVFDWSQYLTLAQDIYSQPPAAACAEATFRCATSRAYYAAYWKGRKYVEDEKGIERHEDERTHKFVIDAFFDLADSEDSGLCNRKYEDIGNLLRRLKDFRVCADYKEDLTHEEYMAVASIENAEKVLKHISDLQSL